uniref:Uncharacterized protein n=1 Tax=Aegilops tauschii subsp. strangulata TaxID=200361 RepID=A0A453ILQ2_AEGTS
MDSTRGRDRHHRIRRTVRYRCRPDGSNTRHASAPPDSAAADPRGLQLPPAPPRSPHLPHRRRQVLWPPHHRTSPPLTFPQASPCLPPVSPSNSVLQDKEIRENKAACYTDVENGLWGFACRSSTTEKENCVLRCLSPECYNLIYGGDPLEEGELDYVRSHEYKYCMHK